RRGPPRGGRPGAAAGAAPRLAGRLRVRRGGGRPLPGVAVPPAHDAPGVAGTGPGRVRAGGYPATATTPECGDARKAETGRRGSWRMVFLEFGTRHSNFPREGSGAPGRLSGDVQAHPGGDARPGEPG